MRGATVTTIQCPSCHQNLPGWVNQCQFCGASLSGVQRPAAVVQQRKAQGRAWEEYVYYILAAIWLLQGLYQIAQGIGWVPSVWYAIGGGSFIGIWGAIHAFIGIGLLTEATWAQFIVKILSWLTLGVSVINIPWLLMEKDPLVPALFLAFNMGVAILQLYVIHKVGDA